MKGLACLIVLGLIGVGVSTLGPFESLEEHAGLVVGTPRVGDHVVYQINVDDPNNLFSLLDTSEKATAALMDHYGAEPDQFEPEEIGFMWGSPDSLEDPQGTKKEVELLRMEASGLIHEYGYLPRQSTPMVERWILESYEFRKSTSLIEDTSDLFKNTLNITEFNPSTSPVHCLARAEWQGTSFRDIEDKGLKPACMDHLPVNALVEDGKEDIEGYTAHRFIAEQGQVTLEVSFIPGLAYPARLALIEGSEITEFKLTGFQEGSGNHLPGLSDPPGPKTGVHVYPSTHSGPQDHGVGLALPPSQAYEMIMDDPSLQEFHDWRGGRKIFLDSFEVDLFAGKSHVKKMIFHSDDGSEAHVGIAESQAFRSTYGAIVDTGLIDRYETSATIFPDTGKSKTIYSKDTIALKQILEYVEDYSDYGSKYQLTVNLGKDTDGEYQPATANMQYGLNAFSSHVSWNLETGETLFDHGRTQGWTRLSSMKNLDTDVDSIVNRVLEGDKEERTVVYTNGITFGDSKPDQISWDTKIVGILLLVTPLIYFFPKILAFFHTRFLPQESLKLPNRNRILETIRLRPGISTCEVKQHTGMSMGTVLYHLKILKQDRHVVCIDSGKYTRYFPQGYGNLHQLQRKAIELDAGAEHRVFSAIAHSPGIHAAALARKLSVSRPSILEAVARLERRGLLKKEKDGRRLLLYPLTADISEPRHTGALQEIHSSKPSTLVSPVNG